MGKARDYGQPLGGPGSERRDGGGMKRRRIRRGQEVGRSDARGPGTQGAKTGNGVRQVCRDGLGSEPAAT